MTPEPVPFLAAVTFDVTGTLIYSPRLGEIYAGVLRRHGIDADPRQVGRLIPLVWQELDCSAPPRGRDRFTAEAGGAEAWWRRFLERIAEHLEAEPPGRFAAAELFDRFGRPDAWEVYPEVPGLLEDLAGRGLRLAVVSNWDHRLPPLLEGLGITRHLRSVVYSSGVGIEKPHPGIFREALDRLGVPPERTLHVGDSRRDDVEGAQAAGMHALHLDRSGRKGDLSDLRHLPHHLGLPTPTPIP